MQQRLGTSRDVEVTPSGHATDNRVTLDAISQLGPNARGVAVVDADVTDGELKILNAGGIRGIRFSLTSTRISSATMEWIEHLSGRVASLGWHAQFQTTADQVVELKDLLNRLPCALVFDHMGHVSPSGPDHPAYLIILRLIDKGRSWVKLSVTFDNAKDGPPGYVDLTAVAQTFVKVAPERLVWGSNWPHPNEKTKPDDAMLFDLLATWVPSEATRKRCYKHRKINLSTVFAGQMVGIKEVDDGIWLISFLTYDLGYIDLEQKTLQTLDNPFGPRLLAMS